MRLCLTSNNISVKLQLTKRKPFAERLPQIVDFQAQRTIQLIYVLRLITFETSGKAGGVAAEIVYDRRHFRVQSAVVLCNHVFHKASGK